MCGIAGAIGNNIKFNKFKSDCSKYLKNRGPDFDDLIYSDNYFFYHSRLSIIDTSYSSNQPMISEDQNFILSYNGEIYNYKSLIDKFKLDKSYYNSDTKLLFYLLINLEVHEVLNLVDGMFAFSFYNKKNNELILARDLFGEKPLYYECQDDLILFSSDAKHLFNYKNISTSISIKQVFSFILSGFWSEFPSVYNNIKSVLPGTYIRFKNNKLCINDFYKDYEKEIFSDIKLNFNEFTKSLEEITLKSVESRLISDSPIGLYLSGGIDSTLIAASIKKLGYDLPSYSIELEGKSENKYINNTIKQLDLKNEKFFVSKNDLEQQFNFIFTSFDVPFSDSSSILLSILSKNVSSKSKCVLTGDGADEILLGYPRYKKFYLQNKLNDYLHFFPFLKLFFSNSKYAYLFINDKKIFNLNLHNAIKYNSKFETCGINVSKWTDLDLKNYLPFNCLKKIDRANMQFGIESRSPYLSKEFLSLRMSIDFSKYNNELFNKSAQKLILKKWHKDLIFQSKKFGFSFNENDIIDTDLFNDTIKNSYFLELVKLLEISEILDRFKIENNFSNENMLIYRLFCLYNFISHNRINITYD